MELWTLLLLPVGDSCTQKWHSAVEAFVITPVSVCCLPVWKVQFTLPCMGYHCLLHCWRGGEARRQGSITNAVASCFFSSASNGLYSRVKCIGGEPPPPPPIVTLASAATRIKTLAWFPVGKDHGCIKTTEHCASFIPVKVAHPAKKCFPGFLWLLYFWTHRESSLRPICWVSWFWPLAHITSTEIFTDMALRQL